MPEGTRQLVLTSEDLREVTRYSAASARAVLDLFERAHPADSRPRDAIQTAEAFARGGPRGKALRDAAWAAQRAAQAAGTPAAAQAARAAMAAAGAAYLHPLADPHQVKHILGAAAHAARAAELDAGDDPAVGAEHIEQSVRRASRTLVQVLARYPAAPAGGARVGELVRLLDRAVRARI